MSRPTALFAGLSGIFLDITMMQILFTSFSSVNNGNGSWPSFPVWLLCGAVCLIINFIVLQRPVTIPVLAALNVALFAAALFALIRSALTIRGFLSYTFLVVFCIITVVQAYRLAFKPRALSKQILHFDALLMALLWLFLIYSGGTAQTDLPLILAVVALNIICNVVLRAAETDVGGTLCGSPAGGALLYFGLTGGVIALIFVLVRFLSAGSQSMVDGVIFAVKAVISAILSLLDSFFTWLMSLFTYEELEADLDMELGSSADVAEQMIELDASPTVLYVIAAVIAAAVIAGLIFLLYRMRGRRIALRVQVTAAQASPRRKRLKGGFRCRIAALLAELRFAVTAFLRRNTPPGTLIYLERWGKKHGLARGTGESMREYLLRLSPDAALLPLAQELDKMYFAASPATLSRADCRSLRREFLRQNRSVPARRKRAPSEEPASA